MIIIFGWDNGAEELKIVFESYCFNCQKMTEWIHCIESEWVTLFYIRSLRFNKENFIACCGCDDELRLDKIACKKLKELSVVTSKSERNWIIDGFSRLIEDYQLSNKTEAQRQFIRSIKTDSLNNINLDNHDLTRIVKPKDD